MMEKNTLADPKDIIFLIDNLNFTTFWHKDISTFFAS